MTQPRLVGVDDDAVEYGFYIGGVAFTEAIRNLYLGDLSPPHQNADFRLDNIIEIHAHGLVERHPPLIGSGNNVVDTR